MGTTQPRRDLARELQDPDKRRQTLHPGKTGALSLLWRMYQPLRRAPRMVWASIGFALSDGLLPLVGLLVLYVLVSLLSRPDASATGMLAAAGAYGLAFFILKAASQQFLCRNNTWFTQERLRQLNAVCYKKMGMDFGLYENAAFMNDIQTADWCYSSNNNGLEGIFHKVFEMGGGLVSFLLLAVLMGLLSPIIPLLSLAFILLYLLFQSHLGKIWYQERMARSSVERRLYQLNVQAADFKAGKDLRLYRMAERFQQVFTPILELNMRMYKAFGKKEFNLSFISNLFLLLIDLVAATLLVKARLSGEISMAQFVMLLSALLLFAQVALALAQQIAFVKTELAYIKDAFDFQDVQLAFQDGQKSLPGEGPLSIAFLDVSFSYPGSEALVLEQLSFEINAGERTALVGLNGAGKTTLVKLLLGLYQPTAGRILINGVDAAGLSQELLFSLFGVVFQEVEPLALSIAQTVAASTEHIDRQRVQDALETAGLREKVSSLPQGMDSELLRVIHEDGVILSGGENQKLMIARALYRQNTRAMIMDEPTAALDALAEQATYQHFDQLLQGKTALFISHRLASTHFCDRILLLDGGRIAQEGSHETLMQTPGLYRKLYETQGKYYQGEGQRNA